MRDSLNAGILATSKGPIFGEKVFYLYRGKRHWVPSGEWIKQNGFEFPRDVKIIPDEQLLTYLPGQPAALTFSNDELENAKITNVGEAREAAASQLDGIGLEIGPGGSPFPVPLRCHLQYGDMYTYTELLSHAYDGQELHDIVAPTLKTDLDTLAGVFDESLDFIVACHVIEHTRNPIGAISNAYRKLRDGGHLVLVIPDKERTFDRARDVTALDHLIADFVAPDHTRERDKQHYEEFFLKADGFLKEGEDPKQRALQEWESQYSIHFHTWTYNSFGDMVDWLRSNSAPFKKVWSQSALPDGIEFYYTMKK